MRFTQAALISLVLTVSTPPAFAVITFGSYDCGQWFNAGPPAKSWLLGFLSGVNFMVANPKKRYDPLDTMNSAEQAYLWMDNYCKANPLKTIANGASDLYMELQEKSK